MSFKSNERVVCTFKCTSTQFKAVMDKLISDPVSTMGVISGYYSSTLRLGRIVFLGSSFIPSTEVEGFDLHVLSSPMRPPAKIYDSDSWMEWR